MTLRRVLVEISVTEQRYQAVLDVRAGSTVTDVAARFGVSRQAVHRWLVWYEQDGLAGLADRSSRPQSSPSRTAPEVEALICDLRRTHPRRGARRVLFELGRMGCPGPLPSRITVHRMLLRHGLVDERPRRRRREDYQRWERDRPMELWQMDIVGGVLLADGREAKIVTGVDDHSRFCVIAAVVPKATGRAVCLAMAGRQHSAGSHLAGRRVTVRVDRGVLHLLGRDRVVLRSLPNPLTAAEVSRIRDASPGGPAPRPAEEPLRVARRVSSRGSICIARQKIQVGIGHAGHTVIVEEADTTFRVYDGDQLLTKVTRITTKQIARFKARKPQPSRHGCPPQ